MYPPKSFNNGTTFVGSQGFGEVICAPNQPCGQDTQVQVCPEGYACPEADVYINAWYVRSLNGSGSDRFRKIDVYARKLSYNPSTGIMTVRIGGEFDDQSGANVEFGINWIAIGNSSQYVATPAATTCSGTTATACSTSVNVPGAASLTGFAGFAIQEFNIQTADYLSIKELSVDVSGATKVGSDALLPMSCAIIGNTAAGATPAMQCDVNAVGLTADQFSVVLDDRSRSVVASGSQWVDTSDVFSAPNPKPIGLATGLQYFKLSKSFATPVAYLRADCGYNEIPPTCLNQPTGCPAPGDTYLQWSGGIHEVQGNSQPPFDVDLLCTEAFVY